MKHSALVLGLTFVVVAVAPVAAQQSLGDVAGSIKLKHPEGEPVVIDQNTLGSAARTPVGSTEIGFFHDTVGDCLTETRAFHDLVGEARNGTSFYRDEWRSRVAEVGLRLDGARDELDMMTAEGRYLEAYEIAELGSSTAGAALELMRGAIADDRPVFSEAETLSMEAIRLFKDAQAAIGVASRIDAAEATPEMVNPIEADREISAVCDRQHGGESSGFESCVAEQRSALDSMTGRSAPAVGLAAVEFNVIRNSCRTEWPGNYVHQDRCEQRRIAAKKAL